MTIIRKKVLPQVHLHASKSSVRNHPHVLIIIPADGREYHDSSPQLQSRNFLLGKRAG
jgi:hypothetical protein